VTTPFQELQKQIRSTGKLPGGAANWKLATSVLGHPKVTQIGHGIAAFASPQNATEQVGEHPLGFGKGFVWDRKDAEILLCLFINAADAFGVSIAGLRAGDVMTVQSAAGLASFTEDTGNL
jgi:hypothetical protein